ncbi:MAG TPA: hypothetical protein VKB34_19595, partial [Povalibacter sp.]|nr:hypothetical protein [Povalibacter sp.]
GEYRPAQSNDTAEGRNANRRVVLVILSGDKPPEGSYGEERGKPDEPKPAAETAPALESTTPITETQAVPPAIETAVNASGTQVSATL